MLVRSGGQCQGRLMRELSLALFATDNLQERACSWGLDSAHFRAFETGEALLTSCQWSSLGSTIMC